MTTMLAKLDIVQCIFSNPSYHCQLEGATSTLLLGWQVIYYKPINFLKKLA